MRPRNRVIAGIAGLLLAGAIGAAIGVYVDVRLEVNKLTKSLKVSESGLDIIPVRGSGTPFLFFAPVADFESAAVFQGDLFVCGRSSLVRFRDGEPIQTWNAGKELPAASLNTVAVRAGIGSPQLWIGTEGAGVLAYDGVNVTQLLPQSPEVRKIRALLPSSGGRVLLGTSRGLYASDGKSLRVFHPEFRSVQVTALAGTEDELWIGTRSDWAWLWRGGTALHKTELPDKDVTALAFEHGRAWVGTPLGISEFEHGELTRHLAPGTFTQALAVRGDDLWVATVDEGAFPIPLAIRTPRPQHAKDVTAGAATITAFVNAGDALLGITQDRVIEAATNETIAAFSGRYLRSGHITALQTDDAGRLWIGYFDRGVDVASSESMKSIEDDVLFCVNRIRADSKRGVVAVGTANGLALFDRGGVLKEVLDREHGLIANQVTDVLFRPNDIVVATPAGISFIAQDGISSLSGFQGLVNNHAYTLAQAGRTLYAGTLGGISQISDGEAPANFTTANSLLRQNWITASVESSGRVFAGTYGSGVVELSSFGPRNFAQFEHGRVEINLNAMLATGRAVYAGTAGNGLAVLPNGSDRWRFVSQGLPSVSVTALEERAGKLYVGTANGLVYAPESSLLP